MLFLWSQNILSTNISKYLIKHNVLLKAAFVTMNINSDKSSGVCYIINIHIFDNLGSDIDELLWKNVFIYLSIYFCLALRQENLISDEINDHKILLLCLYRMQLQPSYNYIIWKGNICSNRRRFSHKRVR